MSGVLEKQEKLAESRKRRAEKHAAFDDIVKANRLDSELKVDEIEQQTGKTWGIDLACVFLPDGKVIVVHRPPAVVFNKMSLATSNNKLDDSLCSEFVQNVVEYPSAIECEKIFLVYPNARDAIINAGTQLVSVDQSNMLGK